MTGALATLSVVTPCTACALILSGAWLWKPAMWAGVAAALAGYGTVLVLAAALGRWGEAACAGVMVAAIAAALWRHFRGRRQRAQAIIGAKSRALRAALVRTMREAAKPRPALRPVPGGAS